MTVIVQQPTDSNGNPQPMVYDQDTGKVIVDSNGFIVSGGQKLVNIPSKADYVRTAKTQTAGIQEASNFVKAIGKGKILLKRGLYQTTNTGTGSNLILYDNTVLEGEDKNSTVIEFLNAPNSQNINLDGSNITIKNLTINSNNTATLLACQSTSYITVENNILLNSNGFFLYFGQTGNTTNNYITVKDNILIGGQYSTNDFIGGAGEHAIITNNTLLHDAQYGGGEGITFGGGAYGLVSVLIEGNIFDDTEGYGFHNNCVHWETDGNNAGSVIVANNLMNIGNGGYAINSASNSTGNYLHDIIVIGNMIFGSNASNSTLSGVPSGIQIANAKKLVITSNLLIDLNNGGIQLTDVEETTVENNTLKDTNNNNSSSSELGGNGLNIYASSTPITSQQNITIKGNIFYDVANTYQAGVAIMSAYKNVLIEGNHGFNFSYLIVRIPSIDFANNILIRNNSPFTAAPTTTPAVPASATAQQNTNLYAVDVYIYGGTVTEIQITKDGTAYTVFSNSTGLALSGQSYKLNPGDSITITYTAAPSWEWLSD